MSLTEEKRLVLKRVAENPVGALPARVEDLPFLTVENFSYSDYKNFLKKEVESKTWKENLFYFSAVFLVLLVSCYMEIRKWYVVLIALGITILFLLLTYLVLYQLLFLLESKVFLPRRILKIERKILDLRIDEVEFSKIYSIVKEKRDSISIEELQAMQEKYETIKKERKN